MNRTIIYGRVSTEDQLEKYGLPSQLRACREHATSRGLSVVEEISDDGVSGATLARAGLDRVRKLVGDGDADIVLMFDVDRLSRELVHLLILKPEIEKKARLEFVASKFEDSPSGRLFFGIRGVISQYEREQIRERTMRGKRERARTGLMVGGRTAYGYRYDHGKLAPDEAQARTVHEIFSSYESGLSIRAIALRLREKGIPPWKGSGGWGHSSVRRILVNETYAGVAYYGTLRREGKILRRRDPADRIGFTVPSLVSREQWERVQSRLAANPSQGRPSNKYLLRGLLYCHCGRRMSGNCRHDHLSYRCNGRDATRPPDAKICRGTIRVSAIDDAVWQSISSAFCDEGVMREILAKHQRELEAPDDCDAKRMQDQVGKLQRRETAALSALLDPDLAGGRDAIKTEYRKIQQERGRLEWEIASRERMSRGAADIRGWLDSTVALIREYIPTLRTVEQRQEFIRGLVSRADWDGSGEVKLNCLLGTELSQTSCCCDRTAGLGEDDARRQLLGALPPLTFGEAIETTKVHSIVGILPGGHRLL